jgi:hypothetical protein
LAQYSSCSEQLISGSFEGLGLGPSPEAGGSPLPQLTRHVASDAAQMSSAPLTHEACFRSVAAGGHGQRNRMRAAFAPRQPCSRSGRRTGQFCVGHVPAHFHRGICLWMDSSATKASSGCVAARPSTHQVTARARCHRNTGLALNGPSLLHCSAGHHLTHMIVTARGWRVVLETRRRRCGCRRRADKACRSSNATGSVGPDRSVVDRAGAGASAARHRARSSAFSCDR